jgi:endonuclease YncB( thermonuclease family)
LDSLLKATLFVAALALAGTSHAIVFKARVINVADGDTVTVLDEAFAEHKIRLMGIDAPEKSQAYGKVSKQSLNEMAGGQELSVDAVKRDRYGRLVGKLLARDGRDINLEQVRRGMAWHYTDYAREQSGVDRVRYADAQRWARADRKGLWSDATPTPPWDYRKAKRTSGTGPPSRH